MKKLLFAFAVLLLTSPAVRAEDNTPPEGFTALFNGEDLSGWQGQVGDGNPYTRAEMKPEELKAAQAAADENMKAHWKAEDGMLIFDGKGKSLCSAKEYGDFELFCDWKIDQGGDSGIYIRSTPQVQIWDTKWEPYFKHGAEKGSGSLWNNAKHEKFPLEYADNPVGEWNTFYIKMVGDHVIVKLNGKLVTDTKLENFWKRGMPLADQGLIELQNHGNTLWFKNVYVKELK